MDTVMPRGWLVLTMGHVEHIDSALMAAYLEDACTPEERARVEAHLSECTDCCDELAVLDETVRTLPSHRHRRVTIPLVGVAVAAVLASVLLFRPSDETVSPGEPPIVQRSLPETRMAVTVEEPSAGERVARTGIVLRWAGVEMDARYQVVVTTTDGDSVWATVTSDSSAAIPMSLEQGQEYLWYVDALLADGGTASSGIHRFQVVQ